MHCIVQKLVNVALDVGSQSVHIGIRRKTAHPHNQWGLHTYREYE